MADQAQGKQQACVFCAIVSGKIPSKKVYEDNDSLAFLDIHPRSKGMTIVAPKKHYPQMQDDFLETLKAFQAAEAVSQMIGQSLQPKSVQLAIIPSDEVPHFHVRLYPIYGDEERPLIEGPPHNATDAELEETANKIRSVQVEIFKPEKVEEKPVQKEWSPEDAEYIRHQIEKT